jgi:hypothetical protein
MGLNMTIETTIILCVAAAFACYLVYRWQKAVVDMAPPPYQEPVKTEPVVKESLDNIDNWNAKIGDKIWYKKDSGPLTESQIEQIKDSVEPTAINPKAAWPFPIGSKP